MSQLSITRLLHHPHHGAGNQQYLASGNTHFDTRPNNISCSAHLNSQCRKRSLTGAWPQHANERHTKCCSEFEDMLLKKGYACLFLLIGSFCLRRSSQNQKTGCARVLLQGTPYFGNPHMLRFSPARPFFELSFDSAWCGSALDPNAAQWNSRYEDTVC